VRVLLAEGPDAAQRQLGDALRADPGVQVLARAADGESALRLALELRPDCVILDLDLPRMDGFTVLRVLMARQPTPVLVVSARAGKAEVFKALELGALDVVAPGAGTREASACGEVLARLAIVRALRTDALRPVQLPAATPAPAPPPRPSLTRLAVIGASTGGPPAVGKLLAGLPREIALGIAVAQHMPENFTRAFAERLARTTGFDVREAEEGDEIVDGRVLVAPGGRHLRLVRGGGPLAPLRAALSASAGDRWCPSVDHLFTSAADAMGERACAVVLTGMGSDGRRGVERVKEAGGLALAESEASAAVFGMPRHAADTGKIDEVLPLDRIGERLRLFAEGSRCPP
jgi:two-component system chemotaxis response regulator CheB